MAKNWRMLDFTSFHGTLRFDKQKRRLQAIDSKTAEMSEHALIDIAIVFIGIGVSLSESLIYHMATNDVVVICCDWKGIPVSSMYPWVDAHGRVAARQRSQAALTVPRSKNAWMRIVKAKIRGQAHNLRFLGYVDASEKLESMARSVRSGDTANVEAQAAKKYWRSLFGDSSFSRLPGSRMDARNSLLDYGYTILRGHSIRAVLAAGLTPALGLYHKNRANAFALADDLIEPFRPVVDYEVARLGEGASLSDREVKHRLLNCTLQTFDESGAGVPSAMTNFAQQFGRYVEGDVKYLDVPVWNALMEVGERGEKGKEI